MGSSDFAKMGIINGKPLAADDMTDAERLAYLQKLQAHYSGATDDSAQPGDAMSGEQKNALLQQMQKAKGQVIDPREVDRLSHLQGPQTVPDGEAVDPNVLKTIMAAQKPDENGEIPAMDKAAQYVRLQKVLQDARAADDERAPAASGTVFNPHPELENDDAEEDLRKSKGRTYKATE